MLKDNILLLIIRIGKFKLFLNNEIILTEVKMKIKVSNVQDAFGARVNQDVFCLLCKWFGQRRPNLATPEAKKRPALVVGLSGSVIFFFENKF